MTITLTSHQEEALWRAIEAGVITSLKALPIQPTFDRDNAEAAVARIRQLRKEVTLNLQGMSLREFAHIGHRY